MIRGLVLASSVRAATIRIWSESPEVATPAAGHFLPLAKVTVRVWAHFLVIAWQRAVNRANRSHFRTTHFFAVYEASLFEEVDRTETERGS